MNHYENEVVASQFLEFLNSKNGSLQQKLLLEYLAPHLPSNTESVILDAACGSGWLAGTLGEKFKYVTGFDSSPTLINSARKAFPKLEFSVVDAAGVLPYKFQQFDCIILNMATHDLENQSKAFENFYKILKPGGKLLVTMANPYYSFPVGVWKRGLIGTLLQKKPFLKLRPYNFFKKMENRSFKWNKELTSRFYPLSEHINNFLNAGFLLTTYQDLQTNQDSNKFDVNYQFYRFPLIILMAFKKSLE